MPTTETVIWFLLFIAIIVFILEWKNSGGLLSALSGLFASIAALFARTKVGNDEGDDEHIDESDNVQQEEQSLQDKRPKEDYSDKKYGCNCSSPCQCDGHCTQTCTCLCARLNNDCANAIKTGSADLDYLDNESTSIIPITTMDTKNINARRLKQVSTKVAQLEAFIDKLINNMVILMRSMKRPTDITLSALKQHRAILQSAIDVSAKKPDIRFTDSQLRTLLKRADEVILNAGSSSSKDELTKLGDISQSELLIKYALLLGDSATGESVELRNCRKDNEYLRTNNEKMREEIRRGLTNYSCEILLRDCIAEKERLKIEVERLKLDLSRSGDSQYKEQVMRLQREVSELHGIIRAFQDEESKTHNLDSKYRTRISELERELREHQEVLRDVLKE
jgi:hypothetical protein